jgi:hypothetical protein
MSWEESKASTPLKRDFLLAFFEREKGFYLTGGSALGMFYLQHRFSYDLDLFSTSEIDWRTVSNVLIDAAGSVDAVPRAITSSPYFHRYELRRGDSTEIIDLVAERVAQVDADKTQIGAIRIDTMREIGVNKLCTLLGRSEVKDLVDLYFLERAGFCAAEHIEEAQQKDGGFDPATISFLLSQVHVREIPQYMLKPLTPDDLNNFVEKLRKDMADRAYPLR